MGICGTSQKTRLPRPSVDLTSRWRLTRGDQVAWKAAQAIAICSGLGHQGYAWLLRAHFSTGQPQHPRGRRRPGGHSAIELTPSPFTVLLHHRSIKFSHASSAAHL